MPLEMKRKDRTEKVKSGDTESHVHWVLDLECKKLYLALQWKDGEGKSGHCPLTMDYFGVRLNELDLQDLLHAIYGAYQSKIPGLVKNLKEEHEKQITLRGTEIVARPIYDPADNIGPAGGH